MKKYLRDHGIKSLRILVICLLGMLFVPVGQALGFDEPGLSLNILAEQGHEDPHPTVAALAIVAGVTELGLSRALAGINQFLVIELCIANLARLRFGSLFR